MAALRSLPLAYTAAVLLLASLGACLAAPEGWDFPDTVSLRAGVLHAPPFANIVTKPDGTVEYSGFQIDLIERLKIFARQDNVTLNVDLAPSPPNFNPALDLVANDCNTTKKPNLLEDCQKFDFIIANYYATPARCTRVALSPPWSRSTITTLKHLDKPEGAKDYTTLKEAEDDYAPVCVKSGTFFATVVKAKFPKGNYIDCPTLEVCIATLKRGECVLSAEDELMSRYSQAWDVSLEVTREQFNTQYKVWPFSYALPFETRLLMEKWLRDANTNATLDELYSKYFQKSLCPVGTAGENCELPCDPVHGTSNNRGVCVCSSTKWTGEDCSIEVEEELNLIPDFMILVAYTMFGINVCAIAICAIWLFWQRNSTQVRVSQPFFLSLVLIGCLISSSTIIALSQEDPGDGEVPACMAIPWLYSIGFSITFGTLFAKILRVYLIFKNAAANQVGGTGVRRHNNSITAFETLRIIGGVIVVDCIILIAWTMRDPLQWEREVISADQFGAPLESQGRCISEYWLPFGAALAALHLTLLGTASYLCYVARDIPTRFSEGKYVSIAMISNLQIFVVGLPILIIIGSEPQTSFFVRSVIIWMNDLAVVVLLFGNLMYSTHFEPEGNKDEVKNAVARIAMREGQKSGFDSMTPMINSRSGSGGASGIISGPMHSETGNRVSEGVRFQDQIKEDVNDADDDDEVVKPIAKPRDIFKSKDSWGGANLSTWVVDGERQDDDDVSNTESDFEDEDEPVPPMQKMQKMRDVLSARDTWGGGTLSQVERVERTEEVNKHSARVGDHTPGSGSTRKTELPPPGLPQQKPSHMSYAESRISKIRGQHALVLAERRSKGSIGSLSTNDHDGQSRDRRRGRKKDSH